MKNVSLFLSFTLKSSFHKGFERLKIYLPSWLKWYMFILHLEWYFKWVFPFTFTCAFFFFHLDLVVALFGCQNGLWWCVFVKTTRNFLRSSACPLLGACVALVAFYQTQHLSCNPASFTHTHTHTHTQQPVFFHAQYFSSSTLKTVHYVSRRC